jgi:hypothetical protein
MLSTRRRKFSCCIFTRSSISRFMHSTFHNGSPCVECDEGKWEGFRRTRHKAGRFSCPLLALDICGEFTSNFDKFLTRCTLVSFQASVTH